jgi:capsular exopolysaccharide synthesis family protein
MKPQNKAIEGQEVTIFQEIFYKYLPYWYVFLFLLIASFIMAYFYLTTTSPLYEAHASILVKDQKRGQEESKMEDAFNVFSQKNILENEIEIIRSNALLNEVISRLHLNTPVFMESGWRGSKVKSAYYASPVLVEFRDNGLKTIGDKIYFNVLDGGQGLHVSINEEIYPIEQWVVTQWGELYFSKNPKYTKPAVLENIKLYFQLIPMGKATTDLGETLKVTAASKQASVVMLRIRDEIPKRGENILTEIINVYNILSIRKKNETANATMKFIDQRLGKVENELDSVEKGIQSYRNRTGMVDVNGQSGQYLRGIEQNDLQLNKMKLQMTMLGEVANYINNNAENGDLAASTLSVGDPELAQLLAQLRSKILDYERLKKTTAINNPIIQSLTDEISKIKYTINENIKNQQNNIQVGQNYLSVVSGRYYSQLNSVPLKERQLVEVSRQRNIKSDIYSYLLQKKEEAAYALKSTLPDSFIVEYPTSSERPVSPQKPFVAALALLMPIVLGASAIGLKDKISGKIKFRSEINQITNIPVIGEVIYDQRASNIIDQTRSRSFVHEQFRQIRTSLRHSERILGGMRRLMVTSSIEGEGKSFVAGNIAVSIANSGKKVALIELDLYQPKLYDMLDSDVSFGITDYLLGNTTKDKIIEATSIKNLFFLPAGNLIESPSELLLSEKLAIFLNELEEEFDVLIIDTPPLKPISDAYEIAVMCDYVIFVVRHDFTPKSNVKMVEDEFAAHLINNVGIVFNGIKKRGYGKFSYGYGYGYGFDDRMRYEQYGKTIKKTIAS